MEGEEASCDKRSLRRRSECCVFAALAVARGWFRRLGPCNVASLTRPLRWQPAATVNEISGAISDIKFDDAGDSEALEEDPQEVSPYIDDILRLYRKTEVSRWPQRHAPSLEMRTRPLGLLSRFITSWLWLTWCVAVRWQCKGLAKSGYMAEQTDINQKMREILVDWIIEVHMKFGLMPVVLYMTVQIIDRFLSRKQVSRSKLQLVGITAMFIASKFEEIYPPEVKDFVYISDKAYTGQEIVKMERAILNALKFEIVFPSVHSFGKRFAKYATLDERTENVAFYLIDATLQNYEMLQYTPSTVAAAGVNLAERLTKRVSVATPVWTEEIVASIGFKETELEACMRDMHDLISKTADPESTLKAVTKKYSHEKFGQVAQSLTPISI